MAEAAVHDQLTGGDPQARILLVDDHLANLVAREAILAPLGHPLVRASSGEHALRQLLREDYAVILMDVQMPGLDGIETAQLIKQRLRNRHVPIIFLTAIHKDPSYIFRGYATGAVDYLLKPFDPEILRSKVRVFVELYLKTEQIKRQDAELRLKEQEAQRYQSELRYRRLLDSLPQCVWAGRRNGETSYANKSWLDYSGLTFREGENPPFRGALHDDEREEVLEAWRRATHHGTPFDRALRLKSNDGTFRWFLVRAVPEREEENGAIIGWIAAGADIDAQHRAEEERAVLLHREQVAREEAQGANRMKDEFLATVSHELRTPLNAILGWTRMMRTGHLEEPGRNRALATIERNAHLQKQLIEDLLDVSRIVTGKMRVEIRRVDLVQVLRASLDVVRPAAEAKQIELIAELEPAAAEIAGDPDRLQQVAWNLLVNAVKFTPQGGKVTLQLARENTRTVIRVKDTGAGIPAHFIAHVFERFRQEDSSTSRRQAGLGLGLSIVRHLVELHGGTVDVASEGPGLGATFTVTLPIRAVTPAQPKAEALRGSPLPGAPLALAQKPTRLEGVSVLVVDDEEDARLLLSEVLACYGAQVTVAGNVSEALAALQAHKPDVLVSDIGLPGEDGYALIRRVRANASLRPLPAAALTAFARAEDESKALEAGFDRHVVKPIDPADLVALVGALARPALAQPSAAVPDVSATTVPPAVLTLAAAAT